MTEIKDEHNHDGIDNHEHFLDMFSEIEMLFQNIKDNTDGVFEILKNYEKGSDEDVVDVIKIDAGEILEIEKICQPIYDEIKKLKEVACNKKSLDSVKELVQRYYDFIVKNEEKSSLLYSNLIKKLN